MFFSRLEGVATETVFMEPVNAIFHPFIAGILPATILIIVVSLLNQKPDQKVLLEYER